MQFLFKKLIKYLVVFLSFLSIFTNNFVKAGGPLVAFEIKNHAGIHALREQLKHEADIITCEVLTAVVGDACPQSSAVICPEFNLKPQLTSTLYFVGGSDPEYEGAFLDALSIMQALNTNTKSPFTILLSNSLDYFGAQKQELVVLLDDNHNQLTHLRDAVREAFKYLNTYYKAIHGKPLYDSSYSEILPFRPHFSLGSISLQEVIKFLAVYGKEEYAQQVYALLKERICTAATKIISSLDSTDKKIVITGFDLWSGITRTPLKHYSFIH